MYLICYVQDELPSIFDYIITSVKEKPANPLIPNQKCFSLTIRLNIQNKEEAIMWLEEYQILSRCDFRIRDSKKENTDRLLWKVWYCACLPSCVFIVFIYEFRLICLFQHLLSENVSVSS